jgi:drug/metabolite transporter (DMT)-like permease
MKIALGFLVMIACTVGANLLLKQGAAAAPAERVLFGIMGWRTFFAFCVFALAGLMYSWVLRFMPLNVAQSFASVQFVAVILASSLLLAEPISSGRWIGIALIATGIALVGFDL